MAALTSRGLFPSAHKISRAWPWAYSSISGDFTDSQREQGLQGYSAETVVEATYRAVIAPWWYVQPDLQYVFNPSGQHGSHDALVLGLRTSVSF